MDWLRTLIPLSLATAFDFDYHRRLVRVLPHVLSGWDVHACGSDAPKPTPAAVRALPSGLRWAMHGAIMADARRRVASDLALIRRLARWGTTHGRYFPEARCRIRNRPAGGYVTHCERCGQDTEYPPDSRRNWHWSDLMCPRCTPPAARIAA